MMYGVEIWGCRRHFEPMEQVQLRALQMFFEVGTLHPNSQGFIATGSGGSACCVGGKDALCEVLVEGFE